MKFYILFILLFPCLTYAQTNSQAILGTWIRTKAEMKDGSRIIDRLGMQSGFLVNRFAENDTAFFWNDPIPNQLKNHLMLNDSRSAYHISDSSLYIGKTGYQIVKLTNDSLIFMDRGQGLYDDRIRKFYFTKMESHHTYDKPTYNDGIQDSVYGVTNYIFPQSAGAIDTIIKPLTDIFATGNLKLRFIINKNGQMKDLNVLENNGLTKRMEQKVVNALTQAQALWKPGYVNSKPANVILEITLFFFSSNTQQYLGWITPLSEKKMEYKNMPIDITEKERDAFNSGVSLAKEHKYDEALVQLTHVLAIDDLNLDAYYLRATIYFEMGNRKAACEDWGRLAQLGQVLAKKYLAKYCNN